MERKKEDEIYCEEIDQNELEIEKVSYCMLLLFEDSLKLRMFNI